MGGDPSCHRIDPFQFLPTSIRRVQTHEHPCLVAEPPGIKELNRNILAQVGTPRCWKRCDIRCARCLPHPPVPPGAEVGQAFLQEIRIGEEVVLVRMFDPTRTLLKGDAKPGTFALQHDRGWKLVVALAGGECFPCTRARTLHRHLTGLGVLQGSDESGGIGRPAAQWNASSCRYAIPRDDLWQVQQPQDWFLQQSFLDGGVPVLRADREGQGTDEEKTGCHDFQSEARGKPCRQLTSPVAARTLGAKPRLLRRRNRPSASR